MHWLEKTIKQPSTLLLISTAISLCLGLVSAAVQARILGPEGRGELATALVPGALVAMLLCLGLPDYFARRAAQGASLPVLSKLALILSTAIGLIALGPYFLILQFHAPLGTAAWILLAVYAFVVPFLIYGYCLMSLSAGAGYWFLVAVVRVVPLCVAVAGIVAVAVLSPRPTPLLVGLILIAVSAFGPLILLRNPALRPSGRISRSMIKTAMSFGLRGWTAGSVALLNQRVDLLLMTGMASKRDLGLYAVSTTLAAILNAVAISLAMPARNKVAQGNLAIVTRTSAFAMLSALTLAVAVIVLLPFLVHVLLGDGFLGAIPVMSVLLIAQIPLAGVVVLTQSLIGAGHPGSPFVGEVVALCTTTGLIVAFFPTHGIIAAAIASGVGNIVSFSVLLVLARRHIQRDAVWRYFVLPPNDLRDIVLNR